MDEFLLRLAKDFGFPALVAAWVLLRLDRRLAHVETCLVRICAILSATPGVQVEDLDPDLTRVAGEPRTVQPVPPVGNAAAGAAKQGG
jgi:hypothetical protein